MNPWDVVSSEPVESTGWANFDNFENALNVENAVIIDNKLCDEGKKETSNREQNVTTENKVETPLGSKVTVEAMGAGDMKIEDTVDSTASYIETNINHQNTESSLYSGCTADKNANPSEIVDSR